MITEIFTTKEEIQKYLKDSGYAEHRYKIHDDLSVEIFDGQLDISNDKTKTIPFKCKNIKMICISKRVPIETFEGFNLPEGLKTLNAPCTSLKSTKGLPSSLTLLDISNTQVEYLEGLPEGLLFLDASNSSLKSPNGIPETVINLNLSGTEAEFLVEQRTCTLDDILKIFGIQ
jgi:hypothetical protein